jgi:hypothetical protein
MSAVVISLTVMSLLYAGWMRFLGRRAAAGALGRGAPGIRLPATKVCEHTWAAAQRVAAPRYTQLATVFLGTAAVTAVLGLSGVSEGVILVVWIALAAGIQVLMLAGTGQEATRAATEVRCEHQQPAKPERTARPSGRAKPRGGRGKGGKRR